MSILDRTQVDVATYTIISADTKEEMARRFTLFTGIYVEPKVEPQNMRNYIETIGGATISDVARMYGIQKDTKVLDRNRIPPILSFNGTLLSPSYPVLSRKKEVITLAGLVLTGNAILVGKEGVGKHSIISELSKYLMLGFVPGCTYRGIYELYPNSVTTGTAQRGELEERFYNIVGTLKNMGLVMYIKDIHVLMATNVALFDMIRKVSDEDVIRIISSTTEEHYKTVISASPIATSTFPVPMYVKELTAEVTVDILSNFSNEVEAIYNIDVGKDIREKIVSIADRYVKNIPLPSSAIRLLGLSATSSRMEDIAETGDLSKEPTIASFYKTIRRAKDSASESFSTRKSIEMKHITEAVKCLTNSDNLVISVDTITQLKTLGEKMSTRVKGQEEAVEHTVKAVRRGRLGAKSRKNPIATFMFMGPTGVGKTETARALAELVFGSSDLLISYDMSEYSEPHQVSRLIGSSPGYVGYEQGGKLIKDTKDKPHSVILFDEIEKAHHTIHSIFLQIMEEGRLTDGRGITADLSNSIVIFTSNLGSDKINKSTIGFLDDDTYDKEKISEIYKEAAYEHFPPEFLGRVTKIVPFGILSKEVLLEIAKIKLDELIEAFVKSPVNKVEDVSYDDSVINWIYEDGYNEESGGRSIATFVSTEIADILVENVIENPLSRKVKLYAKNKTNKDDYREKNSVRYDNNAITTASTRSFVE